MTNANADISNNESSDAALEQVDTRVLEKSKKFKKATPNWRKRLRKTAIATALPLLSILSVSPVGGIANASTIDSDQSTPPITTPQPRLDTSNPGIPKEFPKLSEKSPLESYIYESAKSNLTYGLPLPGGYLFGPEAFFQYELAKHLSPEQFPPEESLDLTPEQKQKQMFEQMSGIQEKIRKMTEMVQSQERDSVDNFREQDPEFYNNLQNNYTNSFNSFNPRYKELSNDSSEIRVPKVNALMAEMRLNQMLGGVAGGNSK